jgi:hypothetical protein
VVDDLIEHRGFRCSSPVVLELRLCLFLRVAPEHAGWFGKVRLVGVSELGRSADRDSGQDSGRKARLRSRELYVRVGAPNLLANEQLALLLPCRSKEKRVRPLHSRL